MRAEPGADDWWRQAVVYQVYPRSFADSTGNGTGDLAGVLAHLDHVVALGADVLWLSPVYPSPQVDNGYDVSDYEDVDPEFGTLADLDALTGRLHAHGMRLMLDVVLNHTSDQHPWFAASRSSRDDPKRDWYWWRPPAPGGGPPTAATSMFSGSAWQLDPATGDYYLHTFAVGQPDLNWENPEVRAALHAMLRRWLARGVDGFRFDVLSMVSKDLPAVLDPAAPDVAGRPGLMGFGPRLHEYLQELHREVLAGAGRHVLTVGEMPGVTVEEARLLTDPARAELDMVFEFDVVGLDQGATKWDPVPLPLPRLKACFARWQEGLAGAGWNSLYWDNHDQPRAVSRFGDDGAHRVASAKALATVLHLHRGTPYVYQGEELGMTNGVFPELTDFRDVEALNHYAAAVTAGEDPAAVLAVLRARGRDNARTPVQWDATPTGGFTTGTPWIGVNPNTVEINAAAQAGDPDSVLAHYRALVALRHAEPAVVHGAFALLLPDDPQVWAFTRTYGDVELLCVANLSGEPATVDLPGWEGAALLLGDRPDRGPLGPWHAYVLRRVRG